jgi:hypothetical protein
VGMGVPTYIQLYVIGDTVCTEERCILQFLKQIPRKMYHSDAVTGRGKDGEELRRLLKETRAQRNRWLDEWMDDVIQGC